MSSDRRARLRHPERYEHVEVAIVYGVAETALVIELTKKRTHDTVIAMTGEARRGGVFWYVWPRNEIPEVLRANTDVMYDADHQTVIGGWAAFQERLDAWPDSYLIMACARAVVPEGVEVTG